MQVMMSVPQNDVLAHPNLRAFLSHVGINSMYEVHAGPFDGAKIQERHNLLAHAMQGALLITQQYTQKCCYPVEFWSNT